jgi:hypothetical protein
VFVNSAGGRTTVLGLAAALALLALISFLWLSDVAADAATPKTDFAKGKGTASGNDPGSQNIQFNFNAQVLTTILQRTPLRAVSPSNRGKVFSYGEETVR